MECNNKWYGLKYIQYVDSDGSIRVEIYSHKGDDDRWSKLSQ
jgi:hypothetical protein